MKRLALLLLLASCYRSPSYCIAQPSATAGLIGTKKADVLVEVQHIPLDAFGIPADVADLDRWSTWLVRVTNRSKHPAMIQTPWGSAVRGVGYRSPRTVPRPEDYDGSTGRPPPLSYTNWTLVDGQNKPIGVVAHVVKVGEMDTGLQYAHVFDYLLAEKAPLADPLLGLHAPAEPYDHNRALWYAVLFNEGATAATRWLTARRGPQPTLRGPTLYKTPTRPKLPSPALQPAQSTWGYLVFWHERPTASNITQPRLNPGKGMTWARTVNPNLLDELTMPTAEVEQ